MKSKPVIHTEGLTKHYGNVYALVDLDLDIVGRIAAATTSTFFSDPDFTASRAGLRAIVPALVVLAKSAVNAEA